MKRNYNTLHAVCAIIYREKDEVLLIKRQDFAVWVLPGGGLEEGENPEEGVLREVLEETGFTATIVRKVAEYLPVNRFTQLTHFFECRIEKGEPTTGSETADLQFFPIHQLPPLTLDVYKDWIRDAQKKLPLPILKKIQKASYGYLLFYFLRRPFWILRFLRSRKRCSS
jgi:8-oxo-dGTP diphosphatase